MPPPPPPPGKRGCLSSPFCLCYIRVYTYSQNIYSSAYMFRYIFPYLLDIHILYQSMHCAADYALSYVEYAIAEI
jgi:hypothetical protein